ncbi:MAG: hypothetical protein J6Q27_03870 [Clostridia bacterium]|nr:hypothetical protein [Clostridia bacterium]
MDLTKIDKNFLQKTNIPTKNITFYNADQAPMELLGVSRVGEIYARMDLDLAASVGVGLHDLSQHTSGGRVRFMTDSLYVAIACKLPKRDNMHRVASIPPHMTRICRRGVDIYADGRFRATFGPASDNAIAYTGIREFPTKSMREIEIYLPVADTINSLHIGLEADAKVVPCAPLEKRMVLYGSSITQGLYTTRPGNTYPAIAARKLGWDFLNLGFAGNAKGEAVVAHYIKKLPMDVFVYDYDHNAPDAAHLAKTHKPFFDIIRAENPNLPIVMMTRPDYQSATKEEIDARKAVIYDTYKQAVESGDKNVYFIDGATLWGEEDYDCCTIDRCHPNDLGMLRMAQKLVETIRNINA